MKNSDDGSPRIIITYQRYPFKEINGIKVVAPVDFLLGEFR